MTGNVVSFLAGVLISVFTIWNERRVRRAQNEFELAKSYREIWNYLNSDPDFSGLKEVVRDMKKRPLTAKEAHAVRLLVFHLKSAFAEHKVKAYRLPEKAGDDIRQFFSRPVPHAAWVEIKKYQDSDFVAFVEAYLTDIR